MKAESIFRTQFLGVVGFWQPWGWPVSESRDGLVMLGHDNSNLAGEQTAGKVR